MNEYRIIEIVTGGMGCDAALYLTDADNDTILTAIYNYTSTEDYSYIEKLENENKFTMLANTEETVFYSDARQCFNVDCVLDIS